MIGTTRSNVPNSASYPHYMSDSQNRTIELNAANTAQAICSLDQRTQPKLKGPKPAIAIIWRHVLVLLWAASTRHRRSAHGGVRNH